MKTDVDLMHKPRRFYTSADVLAQNAGFGVALDGRIAKTPAGKRLFAPTRALAGLLACEWNAQGERVEMASMPATRLAFTAIDRADGAHTAMADSVAGYAASDLLCYFAEGPPSLLEIEIAHWSPVLAWAHSALGLQFVRATGIVHRPQPAETVARVRMLALELDDFALTGLAFGAAVFGSAILALAVHRGMLSGDAAFDLSRLDDAYQEQRWGVDAEAAARTGVIRGDARMLERWFAALKS